MILANIGRRFELYFQTLCQGHPQDEAMLRLKWDHGLRVQAIMCDLAEALSLDPVHAVEAEVAGLLHDAGRFEQYLRYHTFADARSVDHARLGCEVVEREGWLNDLSVPSRSAVLGAIAVHNRKHFEPLPDPAAQRLALMLRDGDKLDILHLVTEYFSSGQEARNAGIELDLPDTPRLSDAVVQSFLDGHMVSMADLETVHDFKVLQMGWIYDLQFPWTRRQVRDLGYMERLYETLPDHPHRAAVGRRLVQWLMASPESPMSPKSG